MHGGAQARFRLPRLQAQPGEHYLRSEPVRSGLWRNIGRTPQKMLGVGSATEGFDASGSYSRMPDADKPELGWIMAGVPETLIGDFGLALGGAAGLELDRYDLHLGTPPGAYLLAGLILLHVFTYIGYTNNNEKDNVKIQILDLLGKIYFTKILENKSGLLTIQTDNLQNGIYFVRSIANEIPTSTSKLIVSHK